MSKATSGMKAATAEDASKLGRGDAKLLGDLALENHLMLASGNSRK